MMLNARLFAAMAGFAVIVAILGRTHALPHASIWLRVGPISFGAFYWQLLIGLVCAVLAFAYFEAARRTIHPSSQILGLAGFFLIASASGIWLVSSFIAKGHRPTGPLLASILIFFLGSMLSAANVARAFLRD